MKSTLASSRASRTTRLPVLLAFLGTFGVATVAGAQTGVSDDRVSLPDGPGSLDGIGDNASVNANIGQMSYGVAFDAPGGFAGVSPTIGLS